MAPSHRAAGLAGLVLVERPVIEDGVDRFWRRYVLIDAATGTELDLGDAYEARLSGDRRHVRLVRRDDHCLPTIETVDLAGNVVDEIAGRFRSGDMGFTWSKDGTRVVFVRREVFEQEWCQFNRDRNELFVPNGAPLQVSSADDAWATSRSFGDQGATYSGPVWAPDGSSIAFSGDTSPSFWLIDPETGDVTDLETTLPGSGTNDVIAPDDLAWSPDARLLAMSLPESSVVDRIGILDVEGRTLMTGEACARWTGVAWAPDGATLAAYCARIYPSGLMLVEPSGATRAVLNVEGILGHLYWAPDGQWIAFGAEGRFVHLVPIDGSRGPIELAFGLPVGWAENTP